MLHGSPKGNPPIPAMHTSRICNILWLGRKPVLITIVPHAANNGQGLAYTATPSSGQLFAMTGKGLWFYILFCLLTHLELLHNKGEIFLVKVLTKTSQHFAFPLENLAILP